MPLGLPRFALVSYDWRRCALYSGVGCLAAGQLSVPAPDPVLPSLLATIPATGIHEASSSVHLRSPIQSFPDLDCADGSHAPSALPRASYPAVTSNARRDWEQVMRHVPGSERAALPPFYCARLDHSSSATSCRTTTITVSMRHQMPAICRQLAHLCRKSLILGQQQPEPNKASAGQDCSSNDQERGRHAGGATSAENKIPDHQQQACA